MKSRLLFLFTFILLSASLNVFAEDDKQASCDKKNSNVCKIIGKEDSTGALIVVETIE
jgi:hypothetical protein